MIEEPNILINFKMKNYKDKHLAVLIPTKNRPKKLKRALSSVANQSLLPDIVIIVNDSSKEFDPPIAQIINSYDDMLDIRHLKNTRTHNLSGSINTGIFYLKDTPYNNDNSFIALLDDDDWWHDDYLLSCRNCALSNNVDWIISGIIRYDEKTPNGILQTIPKDISVDDFLITNPNIQNSNLFIKLKHLLSIDGFDETLICTTDRDICIRLLEIPNISYKSINQHLVHHWAFNYEERLSTPGSETKKVGLNQFYKKYRNRMNPLQTELFKKRAYDLFKTKIEDDF